MSAELVLASIATLLRQWSANVPLEPLVACAVGSEILSRLLQTESAIWTASNDVGVMIVLTIVLPETHLADVEPTSLLKGQVVTTGTCPALPRFRCTNNRALVELPNVGVEPLSTLLEHFR
jgi:hypothetical protein